MENEEVSALVLGTREMNVNERMTSDQFRGSHTHARHQRHEYE